MSFMLILSCLSDAIMPQIYIKWFKLFQANVPILYLLKSTEN